MAIPTLFFCFIKLLYQSICDLKALSKHDQNYKVGLVNLTICGSLITQVLIECDQICSVEMQICPIYESVPMEAAIECDQTYRAGKPSELWGQLEMQGVYFL